MAQYRDFYEEINLIVPGIARPIALPHLKQVIGHFCEKSRIWREVVSLTSENGGTVYDLRTLKQSELFQLEGELVDVLSVTVDGDAVPSHHWQRIARTGLRFLPDKAPPASAVLAFEITLKPADDAHELPDVLHLDWRTDIAHGVAYRLMLQPGKPWSDAKLALYHKEQYEDGENRALHEANNQRADLVDTTHNFWGGQRP